MRELYAVTEGSLRSMSFLVNVQQEFHEGLLLNAY